MATTSQQKYIDYSPPKTPSAVPKTPEIKLHTSPSPSTSSWISDAGHIAPGKSKGNLFAELSSPLTSVPLVGVVPEGSVPIQSATGKKQKRPKNKPTKHGEGKRLKEQHQPATMQQPLSMSNAQQARNPFAMFPGPNVQGSSRPYPDPSSYGKYLNQSLQAVTGLRAPMPFGIFPLPSGPGLIPDTPLFSTAFGTHPGAPGFPMPPNHFGLSAMNRFNEMNLLRMTRPIIGRGPPMGGAGHLQPELYDEPLDPETKLAQTPLDLQKSTCNVAPLVPPSLQLFPSTNSTDACIGADDESLNLSTNQKLITASMTSKSEPSASQREPLLRDIPRGGEYEMQSKPDVITTPQSSRAHKEDQVVILPAASVLPGASPPQRSKMVVIDIEDSDGSQSTATTSKDGKRKSKEHKKDRKLKEGKLKKKKDKKDKSKNKEREREQLEEQATGTSTSSGMMTMGIIGAEEALQVQLRKERKEKKEKRKDKAKKEKRKERERFLVATDVGGSCSGPLTSQSANLLTSSGTSSASVPKLMLKIGGSIATASPQPDSHEKGHVLAEHGHSATATLAAMLGDDANRDGSPELARISALVTRPPKLKISGAGVGITSGKNRKEESLAKLTSGVTLTPAGDGAKLALQNMDESDDSLPTLGTTKHLSGTTNSSTSGSITSPVASSSGDGNAPSRSSSTGVTMGCATNPPNRSKSNQRLHPLGVGELTHSKGASLITEGSKKVHKESKVNKVFATTHNQQQAVATSSASSAPAQMTDVDGNTVWICPACGRVDDGTPMIGCDGCDAWYHWVCVGILVPPEDNEDWYCRVCIGKKQDPHVDERQRKRKKKDKKTTKD
ncbi:uncharacterized protein LOC131213495 [Anopheles bellator]|uniref:uncharacterized protein LOC131213495 n=1 Tax=Anopheles bellator TaxID=139047 RepID=UPI0026489F80|nr:uncharacterized protein LOC131213495 [Anopheles bellator]